MRSNALVLLLISFFFVKFARSQSNELDIQGQTGKLYLEHTVAAKETWYSIGRLYNANPKEIALFNHLTIAKPLNIDQTIEIPLVASNFSQTGQKIPTETLVPVYHIIQEKEWLYRISINHNKVPVPSLEKWNNINKDQAKAGMHLIVGFLRVKTAQSALAHMQPPVPTDATAATAKPAAPAVATPVATSAAQKPPVNTSAANNTGAATNSPNGTSNNTSPATNSPTGTGNNGNTGNTGSTGNAGNTGNSNTGSVSTPPAAHFNGGFFKADYNETGKTGSGQAGTFRSTSGWQDGKYYALMNNVTVGTIIKVSGSGTDKSIYAKVLGQLPDMKESAGLTIRISTAAASELGITDGRFNVDLKY
jgi:LysM repeat protein